MSEYTAEVESLAAAMVDRELSAEERARLNFLLAGDVSLRRLYAETITSLAALDLMMREPGAAMNAEDDADAPLPMIKSPASTMDRSRPLMRYAVAAALLLAACGVAIYMFALTTKPSTDNGARHKMRALATLVESTDTVIYKDNVASEGGEYAAGAYSIESGSAELLLANDVTVDLHGRTRLVIDDALHATLEHGAAAFNCPHGVKGYSVSVPGGMRVVDLGTRFELFVDAGGSSVLAVTQGHVAVHERDEPGGATGRRVAAGDIVELTPGNDAGPHIRPLTVQTQTVRFASAAADFSQTAGGGYPVSAMIDGVIDGKHGWAFYPQEGEPHTAVLTLTRPLTFARRLDVRLVHAFANQDPTLLRRFRLSYTADAMAGRSAKDVQWTVLMPAGADASAGAAASVMDDASVRVTPPASGRGAAQTVVRVIAPIDAIRITAIRLQVLADPTVGYMPQGNAVISELQMSADAPVLADTHTNINTPTPAHRATPPDASRDRENAPLP